MKIVYQGEVTETSADTVAGFLNERNIPIQSVISELNGEVCDGREPESPALHEGDALNVFRIVAGG
ncbi:MAG: MoaD/ThiS family protein [Victivallaceae bacterium]|nr:MoaD/ThiS family protein [Victivallaceae bacterium]